MSSAHHQSLQLLNLACILDSCPLTVAPDAIVGDVIAQINRAAEPSVQRSQAKCAGASSAPMAASRCALVVAEDRLVGIFTARDLVRLAAEGADLDTTVIAEVMTQPVISLKCSEVHSAVTVLATLGQHQIRQLPIVDGVGHLIGLVTQASLLQILDPLAWLTEIEQLQQVNEAQAVQLSEVNQQLRQTNRILQTEISERQRLEAALQAANQRLESRVGLQAAQLVQTDEALKHESWERQQAQVQLERFFAVTPSLLCIAGLDGYFKQLNPGFATVLGYDTSELLAIPLTDLVHPEDLAATQAEIERLAAGKLMIAFENRYRCKDGSYRWFSWNATASPEDRTIYAVAQDITGRKRLEEDLRQERNFIAAVLDTVGALVVVLDRAGHVVSFNHACEQLSGYTASEVRDRPVWDVLIVPEEKGAVQAVFQQLMQAQPPNQCENYWLSKDGIRRLINWSNTVLKNDRGVVEYVIGTGIDVTDQRQIERDLARQYRQGQLLNEITRKIRESLEINEILQTAVVEVRDLLACDRVFIIEYDLEETGSVIQESVRSGDTSLSLLGQRVTGLKRINNPSDSASPARTCAEIRSDRCSLRTSSFLNQQDVQSCIEISIEVDHRLWGFIIVSQDNCPRQWDDFEIELMEQLANQVGIAISQAQLLHNLEAMVEQRTHQLSQTNQRLEQEVQERIQIANALRQSQQTLVGILDNADEAIISIDSQQRILMYNYGAERIFGFSHDEVLHQPLDILLPEGFRQLHRQHVRHFAAASDTSRQMANRGRDVFGCRKTGEEFLAEASISKLQTRSGQIFTVILKDVTEQRQAEAARRRSEEQLRLTTDGMPALISYVDTEQRYRFNNQTYEKWFQIPIADIEGRYIWEVMGDTYYAQVKPYVEAVLSGQAVHFEVEMTAPDGQLRWLLVTYTPDLDEHGTVKGFFGLKSDISDRKAAERMKDEFVSIVGHELRTPLTSIHGSLILLASNKLGMLTPQGQEFLDISLRNTQRLTRLINDVLDLERIDSGRTTMSLQSCNLAELMTQAAQAMQTMAEEKNIQLIVEAPNLTVCVDSDHITQVLTNLLSNAIKFSAMGTQVWLCATQRSGEVLVQVRDQGRGIPSDKLETIFERFQQVDASDSRQLGGTGLGLAICQNIVQRHGGEIWAESTVGSGSTFSFTLPDVQ